MSDQDLSQLRLDKAQFSQGRRHRSRLLLLLLLLAVLLGAGYLYTQGLLTPAVEVRLASVSTLYPAQTFTLLNASGYVVAQRKAAIGSKLTSRLTYLAVGEGDRVKAGQVIARLENADVLAARERAKAAIEVARTALEQAQADLREATRAYERSKEMLARKFVSQADFDAAEARYRMAVANVANQQANLELSKAALAEAEVQVDYSAIRAPFDGVVLTKNADIGDIITPLGAAANARASVVTIADMDSYQVEADVSESNIAQVQQDQPVEIQLDALPDVRLRGKVQMIVPTADRSKASVMVKVAFIDKDPRILPEMSAKVAFLARAPTAEERQPVTAVPQAAVVSRDGKDMVYIARDRQAIAQPVQLGRRFGEWVEIKDGLAVGERVVLQPPTDLNSGAKIRALQA
ncbi:MAG: efflux RND transporter periplasmic adaptor subunit [Candidatus Competibacteraceae bacterium]